MFIEPEKLAELKKNWSVILPASDRTGSIKKDFSKYVLYSGSW